MKTRKKVVYKNISQGCNLIRKLEHNIKLVSLDHTLSSKKIVSRFHIQRAKEGTVPLPFRRNRAEKRSHNLGKSFGEGSCLLNVNVLVRSFS